ncbi:unnamed protein product [Cuscuta epithymum]|uniref:Tubby-like F-box protein n=1 Tax=Cuscuta epithymum TaxID=186058 RepID=A0AAV0EYM5_9ASTE|nr:unnamed protein product [Cuscuta epithymum]
MSFRSIARDIRDSIGSLSRRSFELRLTSQQRGGKSHGAVHELHDQPAIITQSSCWASLPLELLRDVIKRLETHESTWPTRKHVVACAGVCRAWRVMCMEIVLTPELSGKLTFPVSLKQPGHRDGTIQCFIKRDKSKLTYRLFLCLSPDLLVENGKFLLSAKRSRKTTRTEYIISLDADNISRSTNTCMGKVRSNFLGTKFIIYDTQKPQYKKVFPKVPTGSHTIAQVTYEVNVLGTKGPRKMHCFMYSIPASSLEPGATVLGPLEGSSFRRSIPFSECIDDSSEFSSARWHEEEQGDGDGVKEGGFLVLGNKPPRWHEQLQCWCLNFRGRVTVASVKNFQLIAETLPPVQPAHRSDPEKIILQFGKVGEDMFTMDYRYPLSAFQAFAICLSSFDTKLACE